MPDPHDDDQHEGYRNIRPQVRMLIRIDESLRDHYQAVQQVGENALVEQSRVRPWITGAADQQNGPRQVQRNQHKHVGVKPVVG